MNIIKLKNNTIELDILKPGTEYTGSRFDWTGIIKQITVGNTTFLTPQAHGEYIGTAGYGLTNEFGMNTPIAYWKTLPGKEFMKIGVGALTKKSFKKYSSPDEYKIRPFNTEVKTYENRVDFIQNNCRVGSYGYDYIKSLIIDDNTLTITYTLKNTGKDVIKTEEYNHNFLRIDNEDITPKTVIKCNHHLPKGKRVGPISVQNKTVSIKEENNLIYMKSLLKSRPTDFTWDIYNGDKSSINCKEYFPASTFATWGMKHVISPEVFHSFSIKPGEELSWSRKYTFNSYIK